MVTGVDTNVLYRTVDQVESGRSMAHVSSGPLGCGEVTALTNDKIFNRYVFGKVSSFPFNKRNIEKTRMRSRSGKNLQLTATIFV